MYGDVCECKTEVRWSGEDGEGVLLFRGWLLDAFSIHSYFVFSFPLCLFCLDWIGSDCLVLLRNC